MSINIFAKKKKNPSFIQFCLLLCIWQWRENCFIILIGQHGLPAQVSSMIGGEHLTCVPQEGAGSEGDYSRPGPAAPPRSQSSYSCLGNRAIRRHIHTHRDAPKQWV